MGDLTKAIWTRLTIRRSTLDGWRQARAAANLLASEPITRIVASPLLRAQQTARPLAERLGLLDRHGRRLGGSRQAGEPLPFHRDAARGGRRGLGALSARSNSLSRRGAGRVPRRRARSATRNRLAREQSLAGRRFHARASDQRGAFACVGSLEHYALPGRLRLGDTPAASG